MKSWVVCLLLSAMAAPIACSRKDGNGDDLRITADDRRPASAHDPQKKSAAPELPRPLIVLDSKSLTIDGVVIPDEPRVADFEAIFGKADRVDPSGNHIHVYEKLGLLLYESPDSGRVVELSVLVGDQPGFPFLTKKWFSGTLVVQKMRIDGKTTLDALTTKLTMFTWEHGLGTDADTFIGPHQTFFIVPESKTEVCEIAISFPRDDATPPPPPTKKPAPMELGY